MTVPYTYLIRCIPTGEVYYGVRWAKGCHPEDLWVTYFTSSKEIHQRIRMFGNNMFLVQIRKTFDTETKARLWEDKVLRRMNVIADSRWINKSYGMVYSSRGTRLGKKMVYVLAEDRYMWMDAQLAEISSSLGICIIKGQSKSPEHSAKISMKLKGKKKNPAHTIKSKTSFLMNPANKGWLIYTNGVKNIRIKLGDDIPDGYVPGNTLKGKTVPNKHIGKSYDDIYSADRAEKLRRDKSKFLTENNPSAKIRGMSYEEIYGQEKAAALKSNRSIVGKRNAKLYGIYLGNILCFSGSRIEAEDYLYSIHGGKKTNNLYDKKWLEFKNIRVDIRYMSR